mgnify:CR=1 FL=1
MGSRSWGRERIRAWEAGGAAVLAIPVAKAYNLSFVRPGHWRPASSRGALAGSISPTTEHGCQGCD